MIRRPFAVAMLLLGAAFLPVAANAATGYVDGSTELHAGPDYDYPTVAVIQDGAPRTVHVDLTEDISMQSLGVCGGVMDVFIERWRVESEQ